MPQYILDITKDLKPLSDHETMAMEKLMYRCKQEVCHYLELFVSYGNEPKNKNVEKVFISGLDQIIAKYELECPEGQREIGVREINTIKSKALIEFSQRTDKNHTR